jgi:hypothetical protein
MGKLKPRNEAQRKKALGINRLPKKGKEWRSLKPPDKKIAAATVEAWLEKRKRSLRYRPPSGKERAAVFLAQCGVKISERTAQALAGGKKAIRHLRRLRKSRLCLPTVALRLNKSGLSSFASNTGGPRLKFWALHGILR